MIFKGWCKYIYDDYDNEVKFDYFLLEAKDRNAAIARLSSCYREGAIDFSLTEVGQEIFDISIDTYDSLEV